MIELSPRFYDDLASAWAEIADGLSGAMAAQSDALRPSPFFMADFLTYRNFWMGAARTAEALGLFESNDVGWIGEWRATLDQDEYYVHALGL